MFTVIRFVWFVDYWWSWWWVSWLWSWWLRRRRDDDFDDDNDEDEEEGEEDDDDDDDDILTDLCWDTVLDKIVVPFFGWKLGHGHKETVDETHHQH
jgi:hypothetical protein